MKKKLTKEQWDFWNDLRLSPDAPRNADEFAELAKKHLEFYEGLPNDQFIRAAVIDDLEKLSEGVFHARRVICDDTNNTPEMIDKGQLNVDVIIQETRQLKYIEVNFELTPND